MDKKEVTIPKSSARAKHCSDIFQLQNKIASYPKEILRTRALRKMYEGIIRSYQSSLDKSERCIHQIAVYQELLKALPPISVKDKEIDRLEVQLFSLRV